MYVLVESFLVGFDKFSSRKASSWLPKPYPYKTEQQPSTPSGSPAPGFSTDVPFCASSGKSPLLILSDHMLSLFPTCLYDSLSLEEVIFEYQPDLLNLSSLSDCVLWILRSLKRPKPSLQKARIADLPFALLPPFRFLTISAAIKAVSDFHMLTNSSLLGPREFSSLLAPQLHVPGIRIGNNNILTNFYFSLVF